MNPLAVYYDLHGIPENILIPQHHDDGYLAMDTRDAFEKNLKYQSSDWIYRNKKVNYTWNSNGYRCPEWSDINWNKSIVVMGCSLIAGEGLDDSDTIDVKLSAILDAPVINLGVPAGSPDIIYYNSIRLVDLNIRPKAVCILSPEWTRTTYFGKQSENLGSWTPYKNNFYSEYYKKYVERPYNAEMHGYMSLRGAYSVWKCANVNIKVFETVDLPPTIDKARDMVHPGIKTIETWADTMSKWILTI